jgi:hypothetical protein
MKDLSSSVCLDHDKIVRGEVHFKGTLWRNKNLFLFKHEYLENTLGNKFEIVFDIAHSLS